VTGCNAASVRALCLALPGVAEAQHHGGVAFKVGGKLFATCRDLGEDVEIVFGLEPDAAAALVASDARFTRYARAKNAVVVLGSAIADRAELRTLLGASYELVAKPRAKRPARRRASKR